ncbi:hypothetical protein GCM10027456_62670 [Kineosporia babensis]
MVRSIQTRSTWRGSDQPDCDEAHLVGPRQTSFLGVFSLYDQHSGVSEGSVIYHFGDRTGLLTAVIEDGGEQLGATGPRKASGPTSMSTGVRTASSREVPRRRS